MCFSNFSSTAHFFLVFFLPCFHKLAGLIIPLLGNTSRSASTNSICIVSISRTGATEPSTCVMLSSSNNEPHAQWRPPRDMRKIGCPGLSPLLAPLPGRQYQQKFNRSRRNFFRLIHLCQHIQPMIRHRYNAYAGVYGGAKRVIGRLRPPPWSMQE